MHFMPCTNHYFCDVVAEWLFTGPGCEYSKSADEWHHFNNGVFL